MQVEALLTQHGITFEKFEHPAVFTVEQARQHLHGVPGAGTKNLFLRDKNGKRHALVVLPELKQVALDRLGELIDFKRPSFASPERLERYLKIKPGAVSILALINDEAHEVEVYIDSDLWQAEAWQCHPLHNEATLVVARSDIDKFLGLTGHRCRVLEIPSVG